MKLNSIIAAAALLAFGAPALGADLPPILKAPAPVAAPWSGFYVGASVALGKTKGEFNFPGFVIPGTGNITPTGVLPGGVIGAGFWWGAVYMGVELDAAYDFLKTKNNCLAGIADCTIHNSFFMTERIIIGMPLGAITGAATARGATAPSQWPVPINVPQNGLAANVMPYLTAGVAERRIEACIGAFAVDNCAKQWLAGFTGGGGLRIPVSTHVSLDLSYLYVKYNKSFAPTGPVIIFPTTFTAQSEQVARLAIIGHY